jgi:hypothetical protein
MSREDIVTLLVLSSERREWVRLVEEDQNSRA